MFRTASRLLRLTIIAAITILALFWFAIDPQAKVQAQTAVSTFGTISEVRAAEPQSATDPFMYSPVVWSVLAPPISPVKGTDGRIHLVYGLNVNNASRYDIRITRIEVLDEQGNLTTGTSKVLSDDGQDITGKVRPFSLPQPSMDAVDYTDRLSAGQGGVVYFDMVYDALSSVPNSLKHRITSTFQDPNKAPQTYSAIDQGTEVSRQEAVAIVPPLQGDNWVVANGSGTIISPHRYTVQAANSKLRSPEYFAIDFVRLDAQKRLYNGDIADVKNWFGYGSDIRAVAAGKVVKARDGISNNIPPNIPPLAIDQIPGNHVILDIGNGKYAGYGHIEPGSIVVREGDTVQQGQVLGKLGNTGNSDGPHLHFQIMNSDSFLNTNGLPFVFDQMTYQGHLPGTLDATGNTLASGKTPTIETQRAGRRTSQMPLTLDLVQFK